MKNRTWTNGDWEPKADILLSELKASKEAYATCIQADIYPQKRPYFEKIYEQRAVFYTILREEFNLLWHKEKDGSMTLPDPIFEPMERRILEEKLTDRELDLLIVQKEQKLLDLYQKLLIYDWPNVTKAFLQSQAEQLNDEIYALQLDLAIKGENAVSKTAGSL
ncbi:MAG TPA: hypothetical protein VFM69_07115 [Pricia sp.]|nr:hypothetical protein [Pricia sp.]